MFVQLEETIILAQKSEDFLEIHIWTINRNVKIVTCLSLITDRAALFSILTPQFPFPRP